MIYPNNSSRCTPEFESDFSNTPEAQQKRKEERQSRIKSLEDKVLMVLLKPIIERRGVEYMNNRRRFEDFDSKVYDAKVAAYDDDKLGPTQDDIHAANSSEDVTLLCERELIREVQLACTTAKTIVHYIF